MKPPLEAVLVGAGNRGADVFGVWALAHPDHLQVVAVAEPDPTRRESLARAHNIPAERQFATWEDLLVRPQMAQAAIIATQDQLHTGPALAALERGYDVLLEKPIAHRLEECVAIVEAAEASGCRLQICHELRYVPFFQKAQEIVQSGRLGQVITVSHRENVLALHMAHSYVRGNWRRADFASPMILAKCCHDLDFLVWMLGARCESLASVGTLSHFRPQNAPHGAPERCTDGCPVADECPFYAPALYLEMRPIYTAMVESADPLIRLVGKVGLANPAAVETLARTLPPLSGIAGFAREVRAILTDQPESREAVKQALAEGPYGRCVYHCDNDVVDHQIVAMTFEGGVSASLTMHGHSYDESRALRVDGSRATLLGKFGSARVVLEIRDHSAARVERFEFADEFHSGRHGGGDQALVSTFVTALREDQPDLLTPPRESLESHLLAFAAERARVKGEVIRMGEFRERAR